MFSNSFIHFIGILTCILGDYKTKYNKNLESFQKLSAFQFNFSSGKDGNFSSNFYPNQKMIYQLWPLIKELSESFVHIKSAMQCSWLVVNMYKW